MTEKSNMKEECPFNLNEFNGLCPLQIADYLPPETDIDDLKSFLALSIERNLDEQFYLDIAGIVRRLEEPKYKDASFDEKYDAVMDLFMQGILDLRKDIFANRNN